MSLLTLIGPEQAQHRWQAHERNAEKADVSPFSGGNCCRKHRESAPPGLADVVFAAVGSGCEPALLSGDDRRRKADPAGLSIASLRVLNIHRRGPTPAVKVGLL